MPKIKRIGRPSIYTNKLVNEICERIASGESLRRICLDEHMPTERTVYLWLHKSGDFFHKYARAREMQIHYFVDEMIEIADKAMKDGVEAQKARLQIDTLKWTIVRLSKTPF